MKKRYAMVAVCLVTATGFFLAGARAEYRSSDATDSGTGTAGTADLTSRLDKLEARISMLQTLVEKSDREIQAKLAMVLDNEEKIIKQVDIIRVRSTK